MFKSALFKGKNHWFLHYSQEFMVLCEELLSGKFCILVAETLARSCSNAHPELCTIPANGTLSALYGTCSLFFPWPRVLGFGESISEWSRLWPVPRHLHFPSAYQDYCPAPKLGSLLRGQVRGLRVRGSWPHILALCLLVFCFFVPLNECIHLWIKKIVPTKFVVVKIHLCIR